MKKLFFYLPFSALLVISACKRNETDVVLLSQSPNYVTTRQGCTVEAQPFTCGSYSMLHFSTQSAFDAAYTCLEQEYETYNDSFSVLYSQLSDDDYNTLIDSVGFEEEQTLIEFEQLKNHSSLRYKLRTDEDAWLAAGANSNSYPSDHAIEDMVYQSLLSKDGNIRIGNDLIHFASDGSLLIVSNANCSDFELAMNDPDYQSGNVIRIFNSDTACRSFGDLSDEVVYSSTKKYKWKVSFWNGVNISYPGAVLKNFRLKNNSWKRFATRSYVKVSGQVHSLSCDTSLPFSYKEEDKRRKKVKVSRAITSNTRIRRNDVVGVFNAGNTLIFANLTW